jgi:hypothetical protein
MRVKGETIRLDGAAAPLRPFVAVRARHARDAHVIGAEQARERAALLARYPAAGAADVHLVELAGLAPQQRP